MAALSQNHLMRFLNIAVLCLLTLGGAYAGEPQQRPHPPLLQQHSEISSATAGSLDHCVTPARSYHPIKAAPRRPVRRTGGNPYAGYRPSQYLCARCSRMAHTFDIGRCRVCKTWTSSGMFKLCPRHAWFLNKCARCGRRYHR